MARSAFSCPTIRLHANSAAAKFQKYPQLTTGIPTMIPTSACSPGNLRTGGSMWTVSSHAQQPSLSPISSAMPSRTQITELNCEEGWSYIAAWTGVQLSFILHLVGTSPKAKWVVFYPFNDFWGSIDMPEALHPQTLLAYGMNGEDLTPDHGAPVRLRVPRQVGYKNLKYIARISVTESLKNIGDGNGSAAPEIGYSWYGGI